MYTTKKKSIEDILVYTVFKGLPTIDLTRVVIGLKLTLSFKNTCIRFISVLTVIPFNSRIRDTESVGRPTKDH